jgi:hypothetical protein
MCSHENLQLKDINIERSYGVIVKTYICPSCLEEICEGELIDVLE